MFESLGLAGLVLPLGVAIGWFAAQRPHTKDQRGGAAPRDDTRLVQGIAHLVDDDPDQAIAHFVRLIEVDEDTVETHLMLGRLFRKRGEVDRALRLHQNLIARPTLSEAHRNEARFELAQDYLKAGVLDHAEGLFRELVSEGQFLVPALQALVSVFEQQRDWVQACEAAERLEAARGESGAPLIAQYLCEQADAALAAGESGPALKLAEQALKRHPGCVRASLLIGRLRQEQGDFQGAIRAYRKVLSQDSRYVAEMLPAVEVCFRERGDIDGLLTFLADAETTVGPGTGAWMRVRILQEQGSDASDELLTAMRTAPSWGGALMLLESPVSDEAAREAMRSLCERQHGDRPRFRCGHCGLNASLLFWQCPGCREWSTVAPVTDRIGEPGGSGPG